ncbi:unnamed protein product [Linum tenue]|uniref:KIB1-4 beta-propeller domain-containing protein n=1 Tax=Linum tenue TaxID=586396 RepID=A0AAV0ME98_9ROSI|nr:unnamed protein product [Linum tenue]
MEEVHLPNFPSTAKTIYNCALSSPPTRGSVNNCLLMCIEYCDQKKQSVFHFCQPRDKDWTTQLVEPQQGQCWDDENAHLFRFHHIVSFNGELYVVSMCCHSLFRVKLMIDKHSINDVSIKLLDLKLRRPDRPWAHFIRTTMLRACFLVQASPTELMGVELHYGDNRGTDLSIETRVEGLKIAVKKIELYKVNFQDQRWEHVETLPEDTAIFLGSHSDTAVFYKIPRRPDLDVGGLVRGNTVYFMPTRDGYLYAYDVGERSISVSLPCPNANRHDYTEPVWIMPLGCSSSTVGPEREIVAAFRDDRGDHEYENLA